MFPLRAYSLLFALSVLLLAGTKLSLCQAQRYGEPNFNYDDDADYEQPAPRSLQNSVQEAEENSPRVYRPYPANPPPPPHDPSVILVPRLGLVRGKIGYKKLETRPINAFLGLRYGKVGPGLGRFQKAAVVESDTNAIIDATQEPANCPQFPDLNKIIAAEARGENVDDCLTLNIYTPTKPGSYPVMVFVHGEMLFDGSAAEGQPDYFLRHDVILVSVNYRVAPFGFLTTLSDELPGNVALADVQMALEWVQQYIRPFGGNADQVTLFGQAGGATLVHALSLSGKAQGLFHKLILQSGTALNPYFLDEDPLMTARSFARVARCTTSAREVQSLNSCFERLRTTELLDAFKRHWEANEPHGLRFTGGFKLVVGDRLGYLPQHPASMVANNAYPMIVGVTKDAGSFIMSRFFSELEQVRTRNISDYINIVLKHSAQPRHHMAWKNLALNQIFTDNEIRNPTVANVAQGLLELINLILYRGPIIDSIRYTSRKYPTFLYCFDYRGEFHRFGHLQNPLPFETDATLSDDNIYLFPYPEEVSQLNINDLSIARSLSAMWVNFAQYDVPVFNGSMWPNVSTEYGPFLRISTSKGGLDELDYHFGEGIAIPNLYPEYLTTSTSTTSTTTTTPRPYPNYPYYPNYQNHQRSPNSYRAHEHVLGEPAADASQQQRYQNYPSTYSQHTHDPNSQYSHYPRT